MLKEVQLLKKKGEMHQSKVGIQVVNYYRVLFAKQS